jgi:hypothetical protein
LKSTSFEIDKFRSRRVLEVYVIWSLRVLKSTSFEVYKFWSLRVLKSTSYEVYKFWSLWVMKSTSFEVYEFWSLRVLKPTSFEVYKFWSLQVLKSRSYEFNEFWSWWVLKSIILKSMSLGDLIDGSSSSEVSHKNGEWSLAMNDSKLNDVFVWHFQATKWIETFLPIGNVSLWFFCKFPSTTLFNYKHYWRFHVSYIFSRQIISV